MKKIIGLTIAVLLSVSMLSTGAWAFWADTESSANNQLTAGTLDMVPTTSGTGPDGKYLATPGGNEDNGNVVFDRLLPGESGSITWTLVNNGSLPGTLVIASTDTFLENGSNEPEDFPPNNGDSNGDIDAYVGVKLQRGVGTNQTNAEANFTYILADGSNYVPFSGLEAVLDAQSEAMAGNGGNDTIVYKLSWSIASDIKGAGDDGMFGTGDDVDVNENIIQSDTAEVDITFTLDQ
jgi:predicted ribosomally synthesized peptide with SipW-like signal peptide